jgi:predicted glycogen debranching enzyme
MMSMSFDASVTKDFDRSSECEWLEANGIGGWASGTISGCATRRYHGLLVAATRPPVGRMVLLSKLAETLVDGERRVELDANRYPGAVHPAVSSTWKSLRSIRSRRSSSKRTASRLKKTVVAYTARIRPS